MRSLFPQQFSHFGRSTIRLPRLGFGAAPIGNLYRAISEEDADAAVASALKNGLDYFDTAPHYGFGLSEHRLGLSLQNHHSDHPVISTKVGRLLIPTQSTAVVRHGFTQTPALEPVFDYSYDGVMRSFESSLQRLQRDRIDILFAHDLGEQTHGSSHGARWAEFMDGGYRAMEELRASGAVSAIGLGANEWQVCEQALVDGDFDGFLLAGRYTLLEQGAAETFLPLCARRGVAVILGGPFNSGILATGVTHSAPCYYNYELAPPDVVERVRRLQAICHEFVIPLVAAALQFPAAHPQICSVLAGFANARQVEEAVRLMNLAIPASFWQALREQRLIPIDAPVPGVQAG